MNPIVELSHSDLYRLMEIISTVIKDKESVGYEISKVTFELRKDTFDVQALWHCEVHQVEEQRNDPYWTDVPK
jgi:hypothetical protein